MQKRGLETLPWGSWAVTNVAAEHDEIPTQKKWRFGLMLRSAIQGGRTIYSYGLGNPAAVTPEAGILIFDRSLANV